jgi:molybdate transport system substrate-binding protein
MMIRMLGKLGAVALLIMTCAGVEAAEIKVLTAGAMKSVVLALAPAFEKQSGHTLAVENDTAGGLAKKIADGATFDVAVITPPVLEKLVAEGKVVSASKVNLAKVGIGVAVKAGASVPDIATVDAFKRALLSAKTVGYIDPKAGGSSGIYFDKLLETMGIADAVRAKAILKQGGYVAELVAKGDAELAVHQISEILPVQGVTYVGPLPPEVQNFTVYTGGVSATARDNAAAQALVDFLRSDAAAAVLKTKGMERP